MLELCRMFIFELFKGAQFGNILIILSKISPKYVLDHFLVSYNTLKIACLLPSI
jgi:hypothetical protein